MKLIGLMPARNEAWCIRASLSSALKYCDAVVVLDHLSTDDTPRIAREFPRVEVLTEYDPVWRESTYRQRLLDTARDMGATHCATIDADEVLAEPAVARIRGIIEAGHPDAVLRAKWMMLWGSLDKYRTGDGSPWASSMAPLAFAVTPKTAYLPSLPYDIHTRAPKGLARWVGSSICLMHLQHVSRRRLLAKQALYKLNEVLRFNTPVADIERKYNPTVDETGMKLADVPADWWGPEKAMVDADATPWQEREVKHLLSVHGTDRFAGLNLMGLA